MENCQKTIFELHCKPEFDQIKMDVAQAATERKAMIRDVQQQIKENHKEVMKLLNGNGTDGIIVRLDRNERWRTMVSWGVGVLYASIVGWLISKL